MTLQYINTGSTANAGNGDSLRTAFTKINQNFATIDQLNSNALTVGTGYAGSRGEYGYTGSTGFIGSLGFTGSRGAGFTGSASTATGYTGSRGAGFTGSQGIIGYTGSVGFVGSASTAAGYAGSLGYVGSPGFVGSASTAARYAGSAGYTGSAGAGFTGSGGLGFTGSAGYAGSAGTEGPRGYSPDTVPGGIFITLNDANPIGTNVGYVYANTATTTFVNGQAVRLRANIFRAGNNTIALGVIRADGGQGALLIFDDLNILTMYQMLPGQQTPISIQYDLSNNLFGINRYLTMEWQCTPDDVNGSVLFGSVIGVGGVELSQIDPFFLNLSNTSGGEWYLCAYSAGGRADIADIAYSIGIGLSGANGFTGSRGSGYTGSASTATGYTGSAGYAGSEGFVGSAGAGYTGSASTAPGYAGSQGYDGSIGYAGSRGYTGSAGVIGYTGSRGFTGSIGFFGSTGYDGSQGVTGYTGSKGDQGIQGDQGDRGYDGYIGSAGYGFTGSAGIGYTGSRSTIPGYTGSAGGVDLNAVDEDIIPTENAVYNLGSPTAQWKSLYVSTNTIYIGGVAISVPHSSSTNITVNGQPIRSDAATTSTLVAGTYTLAISNTGQIIFPDGTVQTTAGGFVGSRGYNGSQGYAGSQGIRGLQGYVGSQGVQGLTGFIGSVGATGAAGYVGSRGITGSNGFFGSQGYNGSRGDTGYIGSAGFVGSASTATGYTGSAGYAGSEGFVGSAGFTGSASTAAGYAGSAGFTGSAGTGYTGSASTASGYTGSAGTSDAVGISFSISASGFSDYIFSGPGIVSGNTNDPILYLYKGFTYTFVNTTGGSHPFAIRVSNGGADYTSGVSGSQTGTQTFTVPMNAPSTLYYQCTLHSGMGNIINIV